MGQVQSNKKLNMKEAIVETENDRNNSSPSEKERSAEFILQPNQLNQQINNNNEAYDMNNEMATKPKRHQTDEVSKLIFMETD